MYFQASVGIRIERSRVSLVYLKRSLRGFFLAGHALYPLEKEDPRERAAEVRKLVNEFLRERNIPSADIFLGIERDLTILRYIELPLAVKENLRGTLRYEMEKYVPLAADDIYFDSQIIEEDRTAGKLKVLLVAVKKEFIDPYLDRENPLGAGISGIEIDSTALANYVSCRPNRPVGDDYAIVYLDDGHLELSFAKKGLLSYSRYLKIDKKGDGLQNLLGEEMELLRKTTGSEERRLEVVFFGTDAARVVELLKDRKDIDLRFSDPSGEPSPSDVLAPAYGLALKGIRKVPLDINFLPAGLRKKVSRIGYYTMLVGAIFFILSVIAWGGSHVLYQKRLSDNLAGELKQLSAEVASINKTQEKLKELENRMEALNMLRRRRATVLNVLHDLTKAIPEGAWVNRLTIAEKGGDIEGYADSASALIPLLAASPLLKDVAFLSPITKDKDGKERFRIGFSFR